ncbi:hypothetical protein DPMN_046585 [Dreissena polymorpha]|uniref:Uncharacterized protein n=1 Tax=Dreissena polymorpha TaxID=45954 RepID=A0A9D4D822_DREPO|nr:hypothetical protein DPMN_046585 [Dreissena polymorpha]
MLCLWKSEPNTQELYMWNPLIPACQQLKAERESRLLTETDNQTSVLMCQTNVLKFVVQMNQTQSHVLNLF